MTICLSDMGSFHVGGKEIKIKSDKVREVNFAENGVPVLLDENGTYTVEQMYVQYFIPENIRGKYPIIFLHGGSMSGVAYETTPDGREGWLNYFLKNNWKIYNTDSVERGRSGWSPKSHYFQEPPIVLPKRDPYERYRIGSGKGSYSEEKHKRKRFNNNQFPVEAFEQYTKQLVPRWTNTNEIIINGFIELIKKVGPCIILAHSQGGTFAFKIASEIPELIKGIVAIEPSMGGDTNDINKLKKIPIYAVYGDHIEEDKRWKNIYEKTNDYFNQLINTGCNLKVENLPSKGILGNSHLLMMDKNNLIIAELIQKWLEDNNMYL